jgi:hypothetical protein
LDDRVALGRLEHRHPPRAALEAQRRKVRRLDLAQGLAGDDVAQDVLELADVAGPRVALEHADDLQGQAQRAARREAAQDRECDVADLVDPVAQRRDPRDRVEVAQQQAVRAGGVHRGRVDAPDDERRHGQDDERP